MPDVTQAAMQDGFQLDELQVVSDLHLGGEAGFQIFASGAELAWLADQVAGLPPGRRAALLINGDFIDFLAEKPALAFDAAGAIAKLDRVMADPAFAPVFAALRRLLATPQRRLVVNLGNHDLELALPWVRRHLACKLAPQDGAARARLLLITDGTGFACRVGGASVLCLHGNEVDSWNVTDHERLRRIGRDRQCGLPIDGWTPNAGSQLVVEAMNQIKVRYPFVDLLKPETAAVVPILAALNPQALRKLQDLGSIARRKAADMLRMRAGFLGGDGGTQGGAGSDADAGAALVSAPPLVAAPVTPADVLMARAEQAWQAGQDPMTLVRGQAGAQLGLWGATWDWATGKPKHEVLREALEFLDQDRSFDLTDKDDTYTGINALVAPEIDLVLTGHTHLARALPRPRGGGHYFNSGTWARLMRISPEIRQDRLRFARLFALLDGGSIETLQAAEPEAVLRQNTVVSVWCDATGATQAELRQVVRAGGEGEGDGDGGGDGDTGGMPAKIHAEPVANTRYTRDTRDTRDTRG